MAWFKAALGWTVKLTFIILLLYQTVSGALGAPFSKIFTAIKVGEFSRAISVWEREHLMPHVPVK